MVDNTEIKRDFMNNGLTPYDIHIKYEIEIGKVYEILRTIPRKTIDDAEEHRTTMLEYIGLADKRS